MRRAYRVLLIAEAANPEWASVPLIGWSLSRAIARLTDAHLVTHIRNQDAVLRAGLVPGRDVTIIDNERVAGPVWRLATKLRGGDGKGWTTLAAFSSLSYYSFENEVWRQFRSRLAAKEFDLVHRITPLSPTHQSLIARRLDRIGIPFVIGPLNGGVPWPKDFVDRQHAEREWLAHIRGLYKFMPGYSSTLRHSSAILTGSRHTMGEIPPWARDKCIYLPENGIEPERFSERRTRAASVPLKAAFVGRLVPYKGADILLEAAAEFLRRKQLSLEIVGDGPQRPLLEEMVDRMGLREAVRFHGWVPHVQVQTVLKDCDFLALPSVREFGGGVVVEAMALGVPPVVADYAGPSELVDDATGVRVAFGNKQSLTANLTQAIADLIAAPERLDAMSAAGLRKVAEKLTWDVKANDILAIYDAVLSGEKRFTGLGYH